MSYVFISCSHEDIDFAETLRSRLEREGFEVWTYDDRLIAGEDWRAGIDQAIRDALALIVIMSPSAKASEYVTCEWAFAWGVGVKIAPILIRPTNLHPRLESIQYFDFVNRAFRSWDNLFKLIKNMSGEPRVRHATSSDLPPIVSSSHAQKARKPTFSSPIAKPPSMRGGITKTDIFISYAREDAERIAPLVTAFQDRGWSVFWDRRIPAGQTWHSYIGQALDQEAV